MELKEIRKYFNSRDWTVIQDNAGSNSNYDVMSLCKCNICRETQLMLRHKVRRGIFTYCKNCKQIFYNNLIGCTSGKLTIIEKDFSNIRHNYYICKCECGNYKSIALSNLLYEKSTSCGCISKEHCTTHHLSQTKIYKVYTSMKQRCYNPNDKHYSYYGDKGVYVCDEWHGENGFINFYNWAIEAGYIEGAGLSIDRIDSNGPYAPWNCRFVDRYVQQNNISSNRYIANSGLTIAQFARLHNVDTEKFRTMYHHYNDDPIKALNTYGKLIKPAYFEDKI